jgi:hypothetical protein
MRESQQQTHAGELARIRFGMRQRALEAEWIARLNYHLNAISITDAEKHRLFARVAAALVQVRDNALAPALVASVTETVLVGLRKLIGPKEAAHLRVRLQEAFEHFAKAFWRRWRSDVSFLLPPRSLALYPVDVSRVQFIAAALAVLRSSPPAGERWQYELKFDGCRIQLHRAGATAAAFGKNGGDL